MVLIDLSPLEGSEFCNCLKSQQAIPTPLCNGNVEQKGIHFGLGKTLTAAWRNDDPGVQVLSHLDWTKPLWPISASLFLAFPFPSPADQELILAGRQGFPLEPKRFSQPLTLCLSAADPQLMWFIYC